MINFSAIYNYFNFIMVGFLFVFVLFFLLLIYCRKKKNGDIDRKKMKLYGIMMDMSNGHILAISLTIINYLFLISGLLFYLEVNISFICITFILSFLSCLMAYKFSYLIYSLISVGVNCLIVFVSNQVQLKLEASSDTNILIISYLIIILGFIYFTITEFASINNIVSCHNILRRKKNVKK